MMVSKAYENLGKSKETHLQTYFRQKFQSHFVKFKDWTEDLAVLHYYHTQITAP